MTRAVVFDLDGTLIDSLPDVTNAVNALLEDFGLPALAEAQVAGFVGMGERVLLERLIAATALDKCDCEALLARFITHYKAATGATRVFPGALDALREMRDVGFAIGLCTNKPTEPLASVLKALDLEDAFDAVIAGDTLALRKPHPEPLHHVLNSLRATEAVYVGDSPVDAETAQHAGVPFVLYTEGIRTEPVDAIPNDMVFSDFAELADICQRVIRPYPA